MAVTRSEIFAYDIDHRLISPGDGWSVAVNSSRQLDRNNPNYRRINKLGILLAGATYPSDLAAHPRDFADACEPPLTETEFNDFLEGYDVGRRILSLTSTLEALGAEHV